MPDESITIDGLSELSQMLTEMAPQAAKRWLQKTAAPATQVVIDAAQQTVPVDIGVLEEAITSEKHWQSGDETVLEIYIGPKKGYFWGSLQEYGTHTNPPQFWLTRAWESCKNKCRDVWATELVGLLQDLENKQ